MSISTISPVREDGPMSTSGSRSGGSTPRRSFTPAQKLAYLDAGRLPAGLLLGRLRVGWVRAPAEVVTKLAGLPRLLLTRGLRPLWARSG
jgi:hypothetical protein